MPSLANLYDPDGPILPDAGGLATLRSDAVAAVEEVLSQPDEKMDYAEAKLALDALVDPSIDVDASLAELDNMAETARGLAGPQATDADKLSALRKLIYDSGPWNGYRPFSYDHSDPSGKSVQLLSHYLATRRGNCVSMPMLFLILAEKLGLEIALSTAPDHLFVRHRDESGRILNLETTSGALPARLEWYRQEMPMSELALENGLYMRALTRREGMGVLATVIVGLLIEEGRYEEAIRAGEIILRHNPREVSALLRIGTACAHLIRVEFASKYPVPFLIPPLLRPRYLMLAERNRMLFAAAEALGWKEPD